MDQTTLRWILIVLGLIILAALYLFGNPDRKKKPRASRKPRIPEIERREPSLDGSMPGELSDSETQEIMDHGSDQESDTAQGELHIEAPAEKVEPEPEPLLDSLHEKKAASIKPKKPKAPAGPPPEKITTLFIRARDNHKITGVDLLDAAIKAGLIFGEMDIFHRLQEGDNRPVFSMANLTKPGHFDKTAWNSFETSGVALFLALPGPMTGLDAWDAMLATGQRMAELLSGDLLDDSQCPVTRQRVAQIREDMREYDRRKSIEK